MGVGFSTVEGLVTRMFWQGKRVFLTGNTGFKGSWLSLWLARLGASVSGYAMPPPTSPSLFEATGLGQTMQCFQGDICDHEALRAAMHVSTPDIVIHLAAQSLVRASYDDPLGTYRTNVMGTANLLEVARTCKSVRAIAVITSDKCYENRECITPYREDDRLGGYDPYSNSKACAELVVSSYRNSFFPPARYDEHRVAIATARAGNVIGGGDWAADRLVPDIIRAFMNHQTARIRSPYAVRPWQHVLEPLRGYLMLAERLYQAGTAFSGAWNFGPRHSDVRPVEWVVRQMASLWGPNAAFNIVDAVSHPHEAKMLRLDSSKAAAELNWQPALSLEKALALTVDWYRRWNHGESAFDLANSQINQYSALAGFNSALAA